jgi:hypothetical protein
MRTLIALLLGLAAQGAQACGLCIEDKIAAVYDHAAVTRALGQKHHVLFFVLDGQLAGTVAEKRLLEQVASSVNGVDPGSVRVSSELASLSVAYDPARVKFAVLERALQLKLHKRGLRLELLRVMDSPAVLKTAL